MEKLTPVVIKRPFDKYYPGEIAGFTQEKLAKLPKDCYTIYKKGEKKEDTGGK